MDISIIPVSQALWLLVDIARGLCQVQNVVSKIALSNYESPSPFLTGKGAG